jgi:hypothetical protein
VKKRAQLRKSQTAIDKSDYSVVPLVTLILKSLDPPATLRHAVEVSHELPLLLALLAVDQAPAAIVNGIVGVRAFDDIPSSFAAEDSLVGHLMSFIR